MSEDNVISCNLDTFTDLSRGILSRGKALRFQAHGQSMSPLIRDGDILLVEPVVAGKIHVGQIVFCAPGAGKLVVHRAIRKKSTADGTGFLIKGDQAALADGWISPAQVYGRVTEIQRMGEKFRVTRPLFSLLSLLAVLRSRGILEKTGRFTRTCQWLKRLPIIYRYFAEESKS